MLEQSRPAAGSGSEGDSLLSFAPWTAVQKSLRSSRNARMRKASSVTTSTARQIHGLVSILWRARARAPVRITAPVLVRSHPTEASWTPMPPEGPPHTNSRSSVTIVCTMSCTAYLNGLRCRTQTIHAGRWDKSTKKPVHAKKNVIMIISSVFAACGLIADADTASPIPWKVENDKKTRHSTDRKTPRCGLALLIQYTPVVQIVGHMNSTGSNIKVRAT
mmetsp:Transcript_110116/g.322149  ORF Transcript_110116/g.322149 Transcript_110116/m.322149 type:complete len:219 (-) Transcript_110116:1284-1940(-)